MLHCKMPGYGPETKAKRSEPLAPLDDDLAGLAALLILADPEFCRR